MPALTVSNLLFSFGGDPLLEDIDLKVEPGARVGIIGRNGSGKSTLLKLFAGRLEPNRGAIQRAPGSTLSFQTQELDAPPERTVLEEMHAVFAKDKERQRKIDEAAERIAKGEDRERWLKEYDRLSLEQESRGFFDLDRRIEQQCNVRFQAAERQARQRLDRCFRDPPPAALVGTTGVDKAIRDDPLTRLECRTYPVLHVQGPCGEHQQHLRGCRHRLVAMFDEERANPFRHRRTARFPGYIHCDTGFFETTHNAG